MSLKISGGVTEEGVVVGNTYDKYGSRNPIVKRIMKGFDSALSQLVKQSDPLSIHEVGCGEGYWSLRWAAQGLLVKGSDFSSQVIAMAQQNAAHRGLPTNIFDVRSIYDLNPENDHADLVVCCEVLEHLDDPTAGLQALNSITGKNLIVSVPREPIWRALNMARGKYLADLGNTPGHIQHWSRGSFIDFVSTQFEVTDIKTPLPWVMLLCRPKTV